MTASKFPKAADSAVERRQHIAQAAAQIIANKGLEALSMRSVAAQAGCSRGLVEHYFTNKEGLLDGADFWTNAQTVARIDRAVTGMSGLAALEVRLQQILPFTDIQLDEWRVRVVFWRRFSVTVKQAAGEPIPFEPIFIGILEDIRAAIENGEVPTDLNAQLMAEFVLFNVTGIACLCLSDQRLRSDVSLNERVSMILAMLRSGSLSDVRFSQPGIY